MRKLLILSIMASLLMAGCDNSEKFHVKGNITGAEGKTLYFDANTINGVELLDSVKLKKDGSFSFSGNRPTLCPEFYTLIVDGEIIHLSIDSTETVTIEASLPGAATNYTVSGSYDSEKIREISLQQLDLQRKIVALESDKSLYPGDITDSINSMVEAYKEKMKKDYIFKEPMSAYAYYAVSQSITDLAGTYLIFNPLTDRADIKCYATVATAWDGLYHDAPRTEQLCNSVIKGMDNTAKPTPKVIEVDSSKVQVTGIIDVNLPDSKGNIKKITDLKGKVVLLDFTQYSAKESAERTRQMRSLYEKYSSRGFEIYQVSLDEDLSFWRYSTEKLPWVCVHETDGTVTSLYGVGMLPTYFLISRDNVVVKRSELVKDLTAEIEALL